MDAQEPHSSDDISGSNLAVTPEYLQQQRKALGDFLNMSLEATHQANAFDNVEKIALTLKYTILQKGKRESAQSLNSFLTTKRVSLERRARGQSHQLKRNPFKCAPRGSSCFEPSL